MIIIGVFQVDEYPSRVHGLLLIALTMQTNVCDVRYPISRMPRMCRLHLLESYTFDDLLEINAPEA